VVEHLTTKFALSQSLSKPGLKMTRMVRERHAISLQCKKSLLPHHDILPQRRNLVAVG
jgi:hypothetical protein